MERFMYIDFNALDSIKSRAAVRSFFRLAADEKTVKVDFAKIEFLSRTAAHELLLMQNSLSSKGVNVSFLNVSPQVNEMLELVNRSLGKEKQAGFRFVKWLTFDDEKKYEDYLLQL